jgi:tetratricopeptide (TPR) repeat protein
MAIMNELNQQLLRRAAGLRQAGRWQEAIDAYERLLQAQPALPDSWYNLAWLRRCVGHYPGALAAYRQALDHGVGEPEEVHLNCAAIYADHLACPVEARAELEAALRLNPHYLPAWLNRGNLCEDCGDRAGAAAAYRQALVIEPEHPLALARLGGVHRASGPNDPVIARVQAALAVPALDAAQRADLGFALGKLLDEAGMFDAAFAAFVAANKASRAVAAAAGMRYDARTHERLVDGLIANFATPAPAAGDQPPSPCIFICGMFRSGSTLVEQILAAHPQVTAGGELDLLPTLVRELLPPPGHANPAIDARLLQRMRTRYREGVALLHPGTKTVTDKRPDNFLHIGLIKTLFPAAKIVHTRRQALDNCLSIFFLHLDPSMAYALDLQDIAHWYGQYERLMRHWKKLYGNDIEDVDYDGLVAGPQPAIAGLLEYCGLPWDEACMAFHRNQSVVKTASVWQVRQPLYQRSSGRWRHYEKHLVALREALGPAATSAPAE